LHLPPIITGSNTNASGDTAYKLALLNADTNGCWVVYSLEGGRAVASLPAGAVVVARDCNPTWADSFRLRSLDGPLIEDPFTGVCACVCACACVLSGLGVR
jgi:hypothetical protein